MNFETLILAAGKGTRMKSNLPKVLHKVGGKPILQHVIDAAKFAGSSREVIVVGAGADLVTEKFSEFEFAFQTEQLGTGHAVLAAKKNFATSTETVLILCGDTPLLTGELLKNFTIAHEASKCSATILTAEMSNASGYGRLIRETDGTFQRIVEDKDATSDEKKIHEINAGVYCFDAQKLFSALEKIGNDNAQGEYYLPDVLTVLKSVGEKIGIFSAENTEEILGINSRVQLAEAEKILRTRKLIELMDNGVTIIDPATTYIDSDVVIGRDVIIYPNTYIEGHTTIGNECELGPDIRLVNMTIGNRVTAQFSYCHDAKICDGVTLGPYVHIRPNSIINDDVKIGNFVEIKNSNIGIGSKLPHLQYIGDADVGKGVNIGCGSVTCNYDGKQKYRTIIGDNAFIGCNTNLVAPVNIGEGAYIAAGSTITKDVPKNNLTISRARQTNIENWHDKRE